LRRAGKMVPDTFRQAGSLTLDPSRRELRIGGAEAVSLTPLESRLLDYLVLNAGHVLTAEAIINHVWGIEAADRDMLRQLVHRLRSKVAQACQGQAMEEETSQAVYIETVPGLGYGLIVRTPER
jgi:DNA-binding response OmpR family regulator